jgi:hypothetical protein
MVLTTQSDYFPKNMKWVAFIIAVVIKAVVFTKGGGGTPLDGEKSVPPSVT